jgi:hypothetical protein
MSGEQSKRLDALLESVTNAVSKMEVSYMFPPFLRTPPLKVLSHQIDRHNFVMVGLEWWSIEIADS